jgi:hypothetical protein
MRLMRSDGFLQVENRYDDGAAYGSTTKTLLRCEVPSSKDLLS